MQHLVYNPHFSSFFRRKSHQHAQTSAHSMCNEELLLKLRLVLLWWCHQRNMFTPLLKCVLHVLKALGLMLTVQCFSFMCAVMVGSGPSLWECIVYGLCVPRSMKGASGQDLLSMYWYTLATQLATGGHFVFASLYFCAHHVWLMVHS